MDIDNKQETEVEIAYNEEKPWYKKRNTTIVSSTILGIGVLTTIIAIPVGLTYINSGTTYIAPLFDIKATNELLNAVDNKETRINVWNTYMDALENPESNISFSLEDIIRNEPFINQFIEFLTSNLYITLNGTETGAISQSDADKIKETLLANKLLFKNTALATYTNLFSFQTTSPSTPMFTFKDKTNGETINFSLSMPLAGLDLKYNDDGTVNVVIPASLDTTNTTNNVQLTITKFSSPSITTTKSIYFKPDTILYLPTSIISSFPNFIVDLIKSEEVLRTDMITTFSAIERIISGDSSGVNGLTYWNSFGLNYATSNKTFLKTDLNKDIQSGSLYKFLKANAKNGNSIIEDSELTAIKSLSTNEGEFNLSTTPFVSSPSYSNLLFNTKKTNADNYSLELNITNFSYKSIVDNLFSGSKAIKITPQLELSGKLVKTPTGNGAATTYTIDKGIYDFSSLVNLSSLTNTTNGGLVGFFKNLKDLADPITSLTNRLVGLNSRPIAEQITFWNSFVSNVNNKPLILSELKKTNVLSNFIISNIDVNNLMGINANGGTLPTIDINTLKTSIDSAVSGTSLDSVNLSFITSGKTPAITLSPSSGIQYGNDATNDKFASITIYFGNEENSISNFNITSTSSKSNVSFSQTSGLTSFSDKDSVINAAAKRVSIVFEKTTTGGSNTSTSVAYFGQYKTTGQNPQQLTKPIIIGESILTLATKFIEFIQSY
ncbi:MAG: hypothetical protein RSA87_04235 [Malacoplasma sp.]